MTVPSTMAASAVLVGGKAAAYGEDRRVDGHDHDAAAEGRHLHGARAGDVAVTFTSRARLHNPTRSGSYAFSVAAAPRGGSWHGTLKIN